MTTERSYRKPSCAIGLALCAAAVAAGCGSTNGDTSSLPSGDTSTATTPATTTTPTETETETTSEGGSGSTTPSAGLEASRGKRIALQVQVRRLIPGAAAVRQSTFKDSGNAKTGDFIQVRVTPTKIAGKAALLSVTIDRGPSRKITIAAGGFEAPPSDTAVVTARKGQLRVVSVAYSCFLGAPSFCPPELAEKGDDTWTLVGKSIGKSPFVVTLTTKPPPKQATAKRGAA